MSIKIIVDVFEDRYPVEGIGRPDVSEELLGWFRAMVSKIDLDVLPLTETGFKPDMPREIELLLCSRDTMSYTLESDAMGLHIISTPECYPFGEDTPYVRRLRCAVVIDMDEIRSRLQDEMLIDGECWKHYLPEYEEAEATTAFHEIAHAILFASNSGWVSPHTVDVLHSSGELNNDLFDHSSGYGMRALQDRDGHEVWADDAHHAIELMEEWCECQGRAWYRQGAVSQDQSFYEVLKLEPYMIAQENVLANDRQDLNPF